MSRLPSNDELIDRAWIKSIEGEGGKIRESDIYPMIREWAERINATKILDVGCGQGILSEKLNLNDKTYNGIDLSPRLIARAKELYNAPNRTFDVGSAYKLSAPASSFDALIAVNLFHLLEDITAASKEFIRVLKPGGHFYIITANPAAYDLWIDYYAESILIGKRLEGVSKHGDQTVTRDVLFLHTMSEMTKALTESGLKVLTSHPFRRDTTREKSHYYMAIEGQKNY